MPVIIRHTGGFGCTCPSFRYSPKPLDVIKALARNAGWETKYRVTVGNRKENPDGSYEWSATSDGVTHYNVTYSPGAAGGFCKHISGVLTNELAWMQTGCVGAKEVLTELDSLRKEIKDLTKEVKQWRKKNSRNQG